MTARDVRQALDETVRHQSKPRHLYRDNRGEFTADIPQRRLKKLGIFAQQIEPDSP